MIYSRALNVLIKKLSRSVSKYLGIISKILSVLYAKQVNKQLYELYINLQDPLWLLKPGKWLFKCG